MMEALFDKSALRQHFLHMRGNLSEVQQSALSSKIQDHIMASAFFANSDTLHCYLSFRGEPLTNELIHRALLLGKTILTSLITPTGEMRHTQIFLDTQLAFGKWGIPTPIVSSWENVFSSEECRLLYPNMAVLVPTLAFDSLGTRLGYGKGYYDRFLSGFSGLRAGLCYRSFQTTKLPREDHDVRLTHIVCEDGIEQFPAILG